jgi:hypothetical protein
MENIKKIYNTVLLSQYWQEISLPSSNQLPFGEIRGCYSQHCKGEASVTTIRDGIKSGITSLTAHLKKLLRFGWPW